MHNFTVIGYNLIIIARDQVQIHFTLKYYHKLLACEILLDSYFIVNFLGPFFKDLYLVKTQYFRLLIIKDMSVICKPLTDLLENDFQEVSLHSKITILATAKQLCSTFAVPPHLTSYLPISPVKNPCATHGVPPTTGKVTLQYH